MRLPRGRLKLNLLFAPRVLELLRFQSRSSHVSKCTNRTRTMLCAAFSNHAKPCIISSSIHTKSRYVPTTRAECRGEVACWSHEGSLLVVGDCQGTAHFIDLQTTTILFSTQLGAPAAGRRAFASMAFVPQDGCVFCVCGDLCCTSV